MPPAPETSLSLILRIHDRKDGAAWEQFMAIYSPVAYAYLRSKGLQDADARDTTQEVFAAIAENVRQWKGQQGSFRGWLFTIARNKALDFWRHNRRRPVARGDTVGQEMLAEVPQSEAEDSRQWDQECQRRVFTWAAEKIRTEFHDATWQAFWRTGVDGQSVAEVAGSWC